MTTVTLDRELVERILADMRLASADKHGQRRALINELETAIAAQPDDEATVECVKLAIYRSAEFRGDWDDMAKAAIVALRRKELGE